MRPVVVLTDHIAAAARARLDAVADVRLLPDQQPRTYREALQDARYLVVRNHLPPGVQAAAPRLLGVVRHGVGLDMIPMDEATACGLPVANVPGGNAVAVAEYAILAMGLLTRRLREIDQALRARGWAASRALSDGIHNLSGRTVGIVGVGDVGLQIARIAHHGFQMPVLGHRRRLDALPDFVAPASLEDLSRQSHIVVLACPLTPQTHHLCGRRELAWMRPDACLVNVGRGGLVDTAALCDALDQGSIGGVACDVFEQQPLPVGHALLGHQRALLTPHLAGLTEESMAFNSERTVDQVLAMMAGVPPAHLVNPEVWPQAQARLRPAAAA